jgi:hypothetical protein
MSMEAHAEVVELVLQALDEAHQPLRESVLYERVVHRGAALTPDEFVALASEMATRGLVRLSVEHDLPAHDLDPFGPRFYLPAA